MYYILYMIHISIFNTHVTHFTCIHIYKVNSDWSILMYLYLGKRERLRLRAPHRICKSPSSPDRWIPLAAQESSHQWNWQRSSCLKWSDLCVWRSLHPRSQSRCQKSSPKSSSDHKLPICCEGREQFWSWQQCISPGEMVGTWKGKLNERKNF